MADKKRDQQTPETPAPTVDEQLAAGRAFMNEHREAFQELAK